MSQAVAVRAQGDHDGAKAGAAGLPAPSLLAMAGTERGEALLAQSASCLHGGRPLEALDAALCAVESFTADGFAAGACDAWMAAAAAVCTADDHACALELLRQGLALVNEPRHTRRRTAVLRQIGMCCCALGQHGEALGHLNEALARYEYEDAGRSTAEILATRTALYAALERHALAQPEGSTERQARLARLLTLWPLLADDAASAQRHDLAAVARGRYAAALGHFGRRRDAMAELTAVLPQYRACGLAAEEAESRMALARCHAALSDHRAAREHYCEALELLRRLGALADLEDCLKRYSYVEEELGNVHCAIAAMSEVRDVRQRRADEAIRVATLRRELRLELAQH